jgi:anti-sigma B factor antagonist
MQGGERLNTGDEFGIKHLKRDDCTVLAILGRLDVFSSLQFQEELGAIERSGEKHIELDLSEVTYIDSTGAGILVGAYKRISTAEGTLTVAACSPVVNKVLNILGIMEWLTKK